MKQRKQQLVPCPILYPPLPVPTPIDTNAKHFLHAKPAFGALPHESLPALFDATYSSISGFATLSELAKQLFDKHASTSPYLCARIAYNWIANNIQRCNRHEIAYTLSDGILVSKRANAEG